MLSMDALFIILFVAVCDGGGEMNSYASVSRDVVEEFGLSQSDFISYTESSISSDATKPHSKTSTSSAALSYSTKHAITVVSVLLFGILLVTLIGALIAYYLSRRKRPTSENDEAEDAEKAQLLSDGDDVDNGIKKVDDIVKRSRTPSPRLFETPRLSIVSARDEGERVGEEELRKLHVEQIVVSANFYVNRDQLQVSVKRVTLNNVDDGMTDNAFIYLVVTLQPNESVFYESATRPVAEENYFEEAADFEIDIADIPMKTLKVSVFASNRFSKHRLVNAFTYNMECLTSGVENKSSTIPVSLTETSRSDDNRQSSPETVENEGEILFSLCYMPTSGRLTFVALKGKDIRTENSSVQTYLRASLLVSGKTMMTVETTSVRKSSNPVYNEAFVFHTPLERIKDADVLVSVMAIPDDSEGDNSEARMIGKVIVGPESDSNLGRKHWELMLTTPRRPVAQWHQINEFL